MHLVSCAARERKGSEEGNRAFKQRLVGEGRAHAVLVFEQDEAVAWCQFGSPAERPNIYTKRRPIVFRTIA